MENTEFKKILKCASVLIIILSVFLTAKIVGEIKSYRYIGSGVSPQNIITVSGRGKVFAVPDILSFSFTISEEAKIVIEAQNKATTKVNSVIKILKNSGIEEKDIKTVGYNINPKYEYRNGAGIVCPSWGCPPSNPIISGYEVNQTILVKVRETGKGGEILSLIGGIGPSYVSGLNFEIDDLESVKAEARKLAIEDAKVKAEILGKDLGVKIVRLIGFSEQDGGYYPGVPYGVGGDEAIARQEKIAVPEIPAGENEIISIVYLTYEIK